MAWPDSAWLQLSFSPGADHGIVSPGDNCRIFLPYKLLKVSLSPITESRVTQSHRSEDGHQRERQHSVLLPHITHLPLPSRILMVTFSFPLSFLDSFSQYHFPSATDIAANYFRLFYPGLGLIWGIYDLHDYCWNIHRYINTPSQSDSIRILSQLLNVLISYDSLFNNCWKKEWINPSDTHLYDKICEDTATNLIRQCSDVILVNQTSFCQIVASFCAQQSPCF